MAAGRYRQSAVRLFSFHETTIDSMTAMRNVLLAICLQSLALLAGPYDHLVVPLARYAPTAQLSNTLARAEGNVRDGKFAEAAAALDEVIGAKNQAMQSLVTDQGPFPLAAGTARLRYLMEACQYRQYGLAAEGQAMLVAYTNAAGYTRCGAIMILLDDLVEYCRRNGDMNGALDLTRLRVRFDPQAFTASYVQQMLDRGEQPAKIRAVLGEFLAAGGAMNSDLGRAECQLVLREGGDAVGACMAYLDKFPNPTLVSLRYTLDIARASLDVDKPETIAKYYRWLATLAMRQPGDDAHMETLSYLLGEQKKLEALVPEIAKPKIPKSPNP